MIAFIECRSHDFHENNSNRYNPSATGGRIIESNTNSEQNESTAMTSSLDETSTRAK